MPSAPPLTAVSLMSCWSRSLIERGDGSRDTTTHVTWLQAGTAYVDLRQAAPHRTRTPLTQLPPQAQLALLAQEGFAGTLSLDGDVAEWHRVVDLREAAPLGDVGRLRFEGELLVEDGVQADYVEHWVRGETGPHASLQLTDGATRAVLVRVGAAFGWARGRSVPFAGTADLVAVSAERRAELLDVEVSIGTVGEHGWVVDRSTLPHCVGRRLEPALAGDVLHTADLTPSGAPTHRSWDILHAEGDTDVLAGPGPR